MPFDLSAEAQHEATPGLLLEIPGGAGHHHGATGKANGNGRREADTLGRQGGEAQGHEGVVGNFGGQQTIEAGFFGLPRPIGDLAPVVQGDSGFYAHDGWGLSFNGENRGGVEVLEFQQLGCRNDPGQFIANRSDICFD